MSLALTIGGVDKTAFLWLPDEGGQVSGSLLAGERGSLRLVVYDLVGATGYRPALDDEVELADGATVIWAGIIDAIEESGFSDLDTGIRSVLTVSDWHAYTDRVYVAGGFNAGTSLRTVVQSIVADSGLDDLGVTVDAGSMGSVFPNGPLLTATLTLDGTVKDAFNTLRQLTGFIWRIDPTKALIWREPAWESCGYALSDSDGDPGVLGGVPSRQARATNFANVVRLTCGPTGPGDPITHTWHGDGSTTVFALAGENVHASNVQPGIVTIDGTPYPVFAPGVAPGDAIEWDPTTDDGTLTFVGVYEPIAQGATDIVLVYTPQYPFTVVESDPSSAAPPTGIGPYTLRASAPEILTYAEAIARAQALLRVRLEAPREVRIRTNKGIAYPGQSIALSFAERAINATFLITAVDVSNADDGSLEYTLTCVDGTELGESWLDFYKSDAVSSGAGTTVVTGGSGGAAVVLSSPVYLGGSRNTSIGSASGVFTPVPDYLEFVVTQSTSLLLRAWVAARAGTVTVRLYDVTAAAAAVTSAPVTSTTLTEVTATVAVVAGHRYRLEIAAGTSGAGIFGLGQLEGL